MKNIAGIKIQEEFSGAYRRMGDLLCEEELYRCPEIGFETICRMAGGTVRGLEKIVRKELGMSGRELMDSLRNNTLGQMMQGRDDWPEKNF